MQAEREESRYETGRLIGRTSALSIHEAWRKGPRGFRCRVSRLAPVVPASDDEARSSFADAARIFAEALHPGLLPVEDLWTDGDQIFAASPPLAGIPASRLVGQLASRALRLSSAAAVGLVSRIGRAVAAVSAPATKEAWTIEVTPDTVWLEADGHPLLLPSASRAAGSEAARALEREGTPALALLLWDLLVTGRARTPDHAEAATHTAAALVEPRLFDFVLRAITADADAELREPLRFVEELESAWGAAPDRGAEIAALVEELSALPDPSGPSLEGPAREATMEVRTVELEACSSAPADRASPPRGLSPMPVPVRGAEEPPSLRRCRAIALAEASNPRSLTLRAIAGPGVGQALRLDASRSQWVVGRARGSDLGLPDPDVSREHFELLRDPKGGLSVRDLSSKNGLFVNGELTRSRHLLPGDELTAGATRLRLEE